MGFENRQSTFSTYFLQQSTCYYNIILHTLDSICGHVKRNLYNGIYGRPARLGASNPQYIDNYFSQTEINRIILRGLHFCTVQLTFPAAIPQKCVTGKTLASRKNCSIFAIIVLWSVMQKLLLQPAERIVGLFFWIILNTKIGNCYNRGSNHTNYIFIIVVD